MVSVLNITSEKSLVYLFESFEHIIFSPNVTSSCRTVHQVSVVFTLQGNHKDSSVKSERIKETEEFQSLLVNVVGCCLSILSSSRDYADFPRSTPNMIASSSYFVSLSNEIVVFGHYLSLFMGYFKVLRKESLTGRCHEPIKLHHEEQSAFPMR